MMPIRQMRGFEYDRETATLDDLISALTELRESGVPGDAIQPPIPRDSPLAIYPQGFVFVYTEDN